MAAKQVTVRMAYDVFIHSTIDGYLVRVQCVTLVQNAATNTQFSLFTYYSVMLIDFLALNRP